MIVFHKVGTNLYIKDSGNYCEFEKVEYLGDIFGEPGSDYKYVRRNNQEISKIRLSNLITQEEYLHYLKDKLDVGIEKISEIKNKMKELK